MDYYYDGEEAETKQFVQSLAKTSMGLGFKLGMPKMFPIKDNKTATYIQEINKVRAWACLAWNWNFASPILK